ncbi:ABC transporter substrate-binding protein (plasmid) [Sinorhizobium medicae]|uniref:ABC transporter substrate-binding protein n=1 Tax=Sinorhizobium medicae TaxID=110321 RepID=UPI002AF6C694|nr:ABC transporter substrate-binding protein [Sinorhizobium medicae]WQO88509.1 ABC transporter substrate-binding protein [Sinorhizobium medicae]
MTTRSLNMALGLTALIATRPCMLHAEEVQANLKGSGEVVVAVDGGSYEAAFRKAFFEPFTRDTGIKVVTAQVDTGKLLTSVQLGQPDADLTSVTGGEFPTWVNRGSVQGIDYSLFSAETLNGIPEQLRDKNGVGALLYAAVIAFNTTKYPFDGNYPKSWADFYDAKKFPGKRGLPKCERVLAGGLFVGALLADGVPKDKLYPLDIDRALTKIQTLMPDVGRWWSGGAEAPQGLISGDSDITISFNGRISTAKSEGAPVGLTWEQSILQYDYWVIMKGTPNAENANKFLAYISQPKPQADFATAMHYGPVNKDAFKLLPKDLAADLPGSPAIADKQVFEDYTWWAGTQSDGRSNYDHALTRCVETLSQ